MLIGIPTHQCPFISCTYLAVPCPFEAHQLRGPLCRSLRHPASRLTAETTEHLVEQAVDLAVGVVESAATPERAQTHISYLLPDPLRGGSSLSIVSMMPPTRARCEFPRKPQRVEKLLRALFSPWFRG